MGTLKINSLVEVLQYGGQVLKFTSELRAGWFYTYILPNPYIMTYSGNVQGVHGEGELHRPDGHHVEPILEKYFQEPGFVLTTTTDSEIKGKTFSYSAKNIVF